MTTPVMPTDVGAAIGTTAPWQRPSVDTGNVPVTPSTPNSGLQNDREAAIWNRLRLRHFTPSGCGVGVSVTTGSTSVAITFKRAESDASYGLSLIPSWATTVYATSKATTGFTANFGTAPSGSAGALDWSTFRSEDT